MDYLKVPSKTRAALLSANFNDNISLVQMHASRPSAIVHSLILGPSLMHRKPLLKSSKELGPKKKDQLELGSVELGGAVSNLVAIRPTARKDIWRNYIQHNAGKHYNYRFTQLGCKL